MGGSQIWVETISCFGSGLGQRADSKTGRSVGKHRFDYGEVYPHTAWRPSLGSLDHMKTSRFATWRGLFFAKPSELAIRLAKPRLLTARDTRIYTTSDIEHHIASGQYICLASCCYSPLQLTHASRHSRHSTWRQQQSSVPSSWLRTSSSTFHTRSPFEHYRSRKFGSTFAPDRLPFAKYIVLP